MNFSKRLSKSGSVTLPSAMRREYGLSDGEKFDISVDNKDGTVILRRIQGQCIGCGSDVQLIVFAGRYICQACVSDLNDRISEMGVEK